MAEKHGHTPGPWMIDEVGICSGDRLVAIIALPDEACGADPDSLHDSVRAELEANGRLIAAAPDMLEALKAAREALHHHFVEWDGEPEDAAPLQIARSKCDAAIARASNHKGEGDDV